MTDPIADMLTRVRNAIQARKREVVMPSSNVKFEIAKILKEEGYLKDAGLIKEDKRTYLKLQIKYTPAKKGVITGIKRVSKPGLRKYAGSDALPKVLNGMGIAIVSTSKGIMTDKKARELGIGGELLCTVY